MAKPILMPQVGQDLEEGKLIEWKVKVGDKVAKGDIVAVVESEKASFEVEAFEAGTVLDLLYGEGDTTKVLAPLLYVGESGTESPEGAKAANGAAAPEKTPAKSSSPAPAAAPAIAASSVPAAQATPVSSPRQAPVDAAAVAESAIGPAAARPQGGVGVKPGRSSPLARRLAGTSGIDLSSLAGTGPRGAVVKRDIDKALQGQTSATPATAETGPSPVETRAASLAPVRSTAQAGPLHRVWLRKGLGDPVVMIHGFGGDNNAWRVLAAGAGLSRPILAIDLPGHGQSSGGAATLDAMAAAVAATLAEEGVTAADLVGHSLGAAVAVAVAEAARFTVRSLFLISPAGLGPDINGEFLSGFCRARSEATLAPWMALLVADPASIGPAFIRITAETRAQNGVAEAQQQVADDLFPDGTQVFSVRKAIESLPVPIRVVFGGADRIIPPRHMAGLPGTIAQHLFPGVGHMPQIEAREPVARLLVEHLRAAG